MESATTHNRQRLNKDKLWLRPESKLFPFGAISIALIEGGFGGIKDAGGARYYQNPDGTLTMEMNTIRDESDKTKPLSHTYQKEEWGFV
jgi:hypothetical protein